MSVVAGPKHRRLCRRRGISVSVVMGGALLVVIIVVHGGQVQGVARALIHPGPRLN